LQALFEFSEEDGGVKGLGLLPGRVPLFPREKMRDAAGRSLKVPHMGWNQVHQASPHPLWRGIPQDARFYFVHSYYAQPTVQKHLMATTEYGIRFASACARGNIFAVQFHPEKSQQAGLNLLANFIQWDGADK
jgi:glutamine amidotransferase